MFKTAVNDVVKDFKLVEDAFIDLLIHENLNVNYNELLNITEYLKVMIYRAILNHERKEGEIQGNDTFHRIVKEITQLLQNIYQVEFSRASIDDFIVILNKNVRKRIENVGFSDTLENDINEFLSKIDKIYQTNFLQDADFKKFLLSHVTLLIDRLRDKISYKNELANKLSITNPMILILRFNSVICYQKNIMFNQLLMRLVL